MDEFEIVLPLVSLLKKGIHLPKSGLDGTYHSGQTDLLIIPSKSSSSLYY